MLTIAVVATLIGFALLVFALITANFWLAVACIAVCVIGLLILLVDSFRAGKRGRSGAEDDPLFTIPGRESATRRAPLMDDSANAGDTADGAESSDTGPLDTGSSVSGRSEGDARGAGLGSVVSPDAHGAPVSGDPAAETGGQPAGVTGDANDYVRSVTGSFPAQAPTGPQHAVQANPTPGTDAPTAPEQSPGESSQPIVTRSAEAERLGEGGTTATAGSNESWSPTSGQWRAPESSGEGYVGRRRLPDDYEPTVVSSTDPTLPAMEFIYGDSRSSDPTGSASTGSDTKGDAGRSDDSTNESATDSDDSNR